MTIETVTFREEDSDNRELMERLYRNEVALRRAKCGGEIEVFRPAGDTNGPFAMIRCRTDDKHCLIRFQGPIETSDDGRTSGP